MNFKKQLSFYLDRKGIAASHLAKAVGVPKQSVSDWLAGSNPRGIKQVKKVADYFETSIDHLMFGVGGEKRSQGSIDFDSEDWISGVFEVKLRRIKT